MKRPLYFFVVFWGERYRRYVSNILLRSLLAPGNFPYLTKKDGHKLLLCCPDEDFAALHSHPAVAAASRFVELVHVPTEPPPSGRHPVDHMAEGHTRAATICHDAQAYGSLLHPDMVFADGFVTGLERHIAKGTQALLVPALRLAESSLFSSLPLDSDGETGKPLVLSPRRVTSAVIASLHDEIIECEINGPRFSTLPNCVWWRNSDRGLLVHSFTWSPLLIDHAAISHHVLNGLCGPVPDGDYVARNFTTDARIAFVADSDEIAFASWTPDAVGARERRPSILQKLPFLGSALRHALLRRAYLHYTRDFYPFGDHVKARGFRIPLKLHVDDLDQSWDAVAAEAECELAESVGDLLEPQLAVATWRTLMMDCIIPALKFYDTAQRISGSLRFILRRLVAALYGDSKARVWIFNRVRARMRF